MIYPREKKPRHVFGLMMLMFAVSAHSNPLSGQNEAEGKQDVLQIQDAYQPERPKTMPMSAGYLSIQNLSNDDVYIVDVSSPEYKSVSIHRSVQVDGMHQMEEVCPLIIPAGKQVSLVPGGMHLMLFNPLVERKAGDLTTITFEMKDGQTMTFKMSVTRP